MIFPVLSFIKQYSFHSERRSNPPYEASWPAGTETLTTSLSGEKSLGTAAVNLATDPALALSMLLYT